VTLGERWARMISGVPPFLGPDKRVSKKAAAFFEWSLFHESNVPPGFITLEWLGIRIGIPVRMKRLESGWGYFHIRLHVLRYDLTNKAYLGPSTMEKHIDPREGLFP